MDKSQPPPSHLFTLRLWTEELGHGQREWRGKVQHIASGQTRYFRTWSRLVALLGEMLPEPELNRYEDLTSFNTPSGWDS